MVKNILLLLFITSNFAYAQQWVTYKMTYGIEIDFPKDPTVIDTTSAFKMAFVDSANSRYQVSEEPFSNFRYQKRINNKEDLIAFYNHLSRLIIAANPGATLQSSTSVYKDDLLLQWITYHVEGTPKTTCMARVFLTDSKVYMIQTCSADTAMVDSQLRFLISLNVTGGHPFDSQLETETADEKARRDEMLLKQGIAMGLVLRYAGGAILLIWFVLLVFLLIRSRSTQVPGIWKILFNVFRWMAVGILGFVFLAMFIGVVSQQTPLNFGTAAVSLISGSLGIIIAIVRAPSFKKPTS
jgi:hypothetical protein